MTPAHTPARFALPLAAALAILLPLVAGCTASRTWYIATDAPIHVVLPDFGWADITYLKQQSDFVHVRVTLHNTGAANLYLKPVPASGDWGLTLHPGIPATIREGRRSEAGMVIAAGGEAVLASQWFIAPEAESNAWPWAITIDGLMLGDQALPTQRIAMPAYVESPMHNRQTGSRGP